MSLRCCRAAAVGAEEEHGAVTGAEFALDDADHHVAAVCRRGLAEPLRLRTGDIDRGIEIEPELFPSGRIAGATTRP